MSDFEQLGYGYAQTSSSEYGSFWARFGTIFIDGLIIQVPGQLLAIAAPGLALILELVAGIIYVGMLEGGPTGQTIGRRVLNLRVVDATTGQPGIGFGRAVGRYFAKFLSGLALAIGYLWMLWDPRKQTWHDKLVGTVVVKA